MLILYQKAYDGYRVGLPDSGAINVEITMLTPRFLAGATLATIAPQTPAGKFAAFSIGLASHYVLDTVPYWEWLMC